MRSRHTSAPFGVPLVPVYELLRDALPGFIGSLATALVLAVLSALRGRARRFAARVRRAAGAARAAWREPEPSDGG